MTIKKKTSSVKKRSDNVRPWTFEEVPIGSIIEYEEKTWSGASTIHRSQITEAKKSDYGVEVRFGGQHVDAKKLVEGSYKLLRDGLEYPCGVLSSDYDVLTPMEKFKVAKIYATVIWADEVLAREFADDTLDVNVWLEEAKRHKILLGNTGKITAVWMSKIEPEPDMTLQEMCDSSAISTAYHYALGKLGLLAKIKPKMTISEAAHK